MSQICGACSNSDGTPRGKYIGLHEFQPLFRKFTDTWDRKSREAALLETQPELLKALKACPIGHVECPECAGNGGEDGYLDDGTRAVIPCAVCKGAGHTLCETCQGVGKLSDAEDARSAAAKTMSASTPRICAACREDNGKPKDSYLGIVKFDQMRAEYYDSEIDKLPDPATERWLAAYRYKHRTMCSPGYVHCDACTGLGGHSEFNRIYTCRICGGVGYRRCGKCHGTGAAG
jgi:hypothetical protein